MKTKMSNINTYLANANESLTATNYNEIDVLVLAQLSYVPFEKIFKDYTKLCMSVCRFAQVIAQHDAFTWKIENGEFLLAEQSCISDKLNHVTDELLRVTNREQRLYLINLLERMAVPEMIAGEFDGVPGKIAAALGGFAKAPQKERKAFYKAVFIFMKSVLWK